MSNGVVVLESLTDTDAIFRWRDGAFNIPCQRPGLASDPVTARVVKGVTGIAVRDAITS